MHERANNFSNIWRVLVKAETTLCNFFVWHKSITMKKNNTVCPFHVTPQQKLHIFFLRNFNNNCLHMALSWVAEDCSCVILTLLPALITWWKWLLAPSKSGLAFSGLILVGGCFKRYSSNLHSPFTRCERISIRNMEKRILNNDRKK